MQIDRLTLSQALTAPQRRRAWRRRRWSDPVRFIAIAAGIAAAFALLGVMHGP